MTMTSLQIRLGGHLDAESWARRHAAGQVPDRWPYGLDRLAGHGFALSAADPYQGGTVGRQAARVARGLGHYEWLETARMESQAAGAELCVCWDERIGVPSALLGRVPVATGVIALTDRGAAQRRVAGAALRRAHQVWALSTAQLPLLRDEAGVPAGRLHHLLFGIDCDFFTPGDAQPRPGLVASAGNDQHRDHATVVRAMALVRRRVPDARLEIATHHPIEVPADLGIRHPQLSHGDLRELYRRSQVVVVDRAIAGEAALVAHLEGLLGAKVHGISVRRLDLVDETTSVEVRYEVPRPSSTGATATAGTTVPTEATSGWSE